MTDLYAIGWDVGAWHCDNGASRDALVVLHAVGNGQPEVLGSVWRGNLRVTINAEQGPALILAFLRCCGIREPEGQARLVLAIDTPLGWPNAFHVLFGGSTIPAVPKRKRENALLNRRTDLRLWERGFKPLSPVQDMIGSQSTKGLHVLRRAGFQCTPEGIWTLNFGAGMTATAVETYPTPCRESATAKGYFKRLVSSDAMTVPGGAKAKQDAEDALQCAVVAYLFQTSRDCFDQPPTDVPEREGWIWVPADCFRSQRETA